MRVHLRAMSTAAVLLSALVIAACATTTTTPGPVISDTTFGGGVVAPVPTRGTTVLAQAEYIFTADLYASATATDADSLKMATKAYRSGQALLDLRCNIYLDALGTANQAAANERKQVGIIGGFTSAIMGLTGGTAKAIAGTAATFSFAGSSMDAFTSSFLFSDAAKSVTKLVRQAQAIYKTAAQEQMANLDYAGAVSLLTGYEEVCRPAQIRSLIDEAVAAAKIVAEPPAALPSDGAVIALLGSLTTVLGRPVTETDAIALYAWFTSDTNARLTVAGNSDFVNKLVGTPAAITSLEGKLSPVFAPLAITGNVVSARWAVPVATVKAAKVPPPVTPVKAPLFTPMLSVVK